MEGSGANEDTFPSPVISALDAELTYLKKGWGPCASKISKHLSVFIQAGFQVLPTFVHCADVFSQFKTYVGREPPGWV